ncbi:MAG: flagellar FlbD family protein [Firmicutes bacterium]|nr:flagellar FlbD family protein [Bacillota bacterium]
MVELTKLNGETIIINALQIEYVELIPESKIIMMNGKFHIVSENKDEVQRKVLDFLRSFHKGTEGEA